MSAGNLLGSLFTGIVFSALWVVLGAAIDKVGLVFNRTIHLIPTFQDALNGFTLTQTIWIIIPVIGWILIWFNYAQNESNEAGGLV